jgi:hypothetical protein
MKHSETVLTFSATKPSPGEHVREFYRKQGEQRERERIERLLTDKLGTGDKSWSPVYVMSLINDSN